MGELFRLDDEAPEEQVIRNFSPERWSEKQPQRLRARARVARIGGKDFAYQIGLGVHHAEEAADGIGVALPGGRVRFTAFRDRPAPPDLVVAGCDPSFALVREILASERGLRILWISAGSEAALRALARGAVHVAGIHLQDPETGRYNSPWVDRLVPFPATRLSYARWEQAILLAPGNPLGIRGLSDLGRPDVRYLNREAGSGSRNLVEAALREAGVPLASVPGFMDTQAGGHRAVADAVASGAANAGVAIRAVGDPRGLAAIPLAEEPYDLVIPDHFLELPAVAALVSLLGRPFVRTQVEALGGYDASQMGMPA